MISPEEIRRRAEREYPRFVSRWITGEPFERLEFPAGALPADISELRDAIDQLRKQAKTDKRPGYGINWVTRRTSQHGTQTLPERIKIETGADLLALANKQQEFDQFTEDIAYIRSDYPQLEEWLQANWKQIVKYHGIWPELLTACRYWGERTAGTFVREIALPLPTKFVEGHTAILQQLLDRILPDELVDTNATDFWSRYGLKQDEPFFRIRFLDRQFERLTGLKIDDIALQVTGANVLPIEKQVVIIFENKTPFLSIKGREDTIAIFGAGYGVEGLGSINWLRGCDVYYWGDLDAQGFEILSLLRSRLPDAKSVLMNVQVMQELAHFVQPGSPTVLKDLPHLTAQEKEVYRTVTLENRRLEQERVPMDYLYRALDSLKKPRQVGD